ncbi:conserved exported protein of unknown function [Methylorubrum extorquens]|uniref:Lysozyme inhibitor LprI N-terminal domain-containing protein n=1 Tax=Methylorubrum extorquens TaxID=408 RepID=A0A2N9AQ89_METEX|nr:conserved exported protein of unknown function [Methylorubrum extorquens]
MAVAGLRALSGLRAPNGTKTAMMNRTPLLLAALSLGLVCGAARAEDGPPKLDVAATCQSAQRVQKTLSDNVSADACLNSERGAERDLKKRWSEFPAAARTQCTQQFQAGGFPSYVELLTCLELASGAVPTQPALSTLRGSPMAAVQPAAATGRVGAPSPASRRPPSAPTRSRCSRASSPAAYPRRPMSV